MNIKNDVGFTLSTSLIQKVANERKTTDEPTNLSVKTETPEIGANRSKSSRNPLEGNFVKKNSETSRYVQGVMTGLRMESELQVKLNGIVDLYKNEASVLDSYAERILTGKKAAKAAVDAVQSEVAEKETQRMEDGRKEFEEQIETKIEENVAENSAGSLITEDLSAQTDETVTVQSPETAVVASEIGALQQNKGTSAATNEATSSSGNSKTKVKVDIII